MKLISWGFIGCGEVTEKKSGPAFNEVEGSHVEAVMSRSEEKVRSYAERHHIKKWYTDAQELIDDPEVNAIYIATPPSSHATFAIMAMKAGKPAYYRRYLPYFQKVKDILSQQLIGEVINVQIRFSVPPRDLDASCAKQLPWRLQPDIAGGGYFYDLAPHQLDILQHLFGVITRAHGYCANRAHLYQAEDTISACFLFENGLPGSASWCFVGHQSAKEDCIEIIGDKGSLSFSVYNYDPIKLITSEGATEIEVPNPSFVQLPIIEAVIHDLQGFGVCTCTSVSATPVNWVMDRILGKL